MKLNYDSTDYDDFAVQAGFECASDTMIDIANRIDNSDDEIEIIGAHFKYKRSYYKMKRNANKMLKFLELCFYQPFEMLCNDDEQLIAFRKKQK